jgi:hypothetical protein
MFTTTTSPELSQKYSPEMTDEDIELLLCHLRPSTTTVAAAAALMHHLRQDSRRSADHVLKRPSPSLSGSG